MNVEELVKQRMEEGKCPICGLDIKLDYQIVIHPKYGKVRLCKEHYVDPHILEETIVNGQANNYLREGHNI